MSMIVIIIIIICNLPIVIVLNKMIKHGGGFNRDYCTVGQGGGLRGSNSRDVVRQALFIDAVGRRYQRSNRE